MFNVIEPQEHLLYKSSIDLFLQELHIAVGLKNDQDLTHATYVLLEEKIEGIEGGILLLKQPLEVSSKEVRSYLRALCPQYTPYSEIWTGRIAFRFSKDISGWDYEKISTLLYCALYEDLVAFSVKENTPFFYLTLPLVEHLSIDMLGFWPYLLKVSPHESLDGLFHGILSLIKAQQDVPSNHPLGKTEETNRPFSPQNRDNIITS